MKGVDIMEGFSYWYLESGNEIQMAYESICNYIPKSAVEMFFEEEGQNTPSNQQTGNTVINHIKNVITAIKNMINNIIAKVSDMIQKFFMSKNERNQFEEFKRILAENPEYKNKQIRVKDFKKIRAEYQKSLDKIDQNIANAQRMKEEEAAATVEKMKQLAENTVKGIKSGATAVFSVDTALRLAENNRDFAKWINKKLENEKIIIENIEKQIGSERAKDFQKKIKSTTHILSLHRCKVWLLGQYAGTTSGALDRVIQDFENLLSPKMDAKSNMKRVSNMRIIDDVIGAYNTKTGSNETKVSLAKKGLKVKKEVDSIKSIFNRRENERDYEKRMKEREKERKKKAKSRNKMKNYLLS